MGLIISAIEEILVALVVITVFCIVRSRDREVGRNREPEIQNNFAPFRRVVAVRPDNNYQNRRQDVEAKSRGICWCPSPVGRGVHIFHPKRFCGCYKTKWTYSNAEDGTSTVFSRKESGSILLENEIVRLPRNERQKLPDEIRCLICLFNVRDAVFRPCGHLLMCQNCMMFYQTCPVCGGSLKAWDVASYNL